MIVELGACTTRRGAVSSRDQHLAVGEQRRRRVDASNIHATGGFPSARGWVVELGAVVRVGAATIAKPASNQHRPVIEQRGGVAGTGFSHAARGRPLARGRVVKLGGSRARIRPRRTAIADPAGDQHLAVWEKRCCVTPTGSRHRAGSGPLACRRVIQLGAREKACSVAAPGNQHFTVRKQCRGMADARRGHAASRSPGIGTPKGWDSRASQQSDDEQSYYHLRANHSKAVHVCNLL